MNSARSCSPQFRVSDTQSLSGERRTNTIAIIQFGIVTIVCAFTSTYSICVAMDIVLADHVCLSAPVNNGGHHTDDIRVIYWQLKYIVSDIHTMTILIIS
jgi:hypothetical protein